MNKKTLLGVTFAALCFSGASFAATAPAAATPAPQDMTCKDFLLLNPKAQTPMAFWVANYDTDYKHGDYVNAQVVGSITPMIIQECQKHPEKTVGSMKEKISAAAQAKVKQLALE
ncbi:HdeA/HdeB family chaperone [Plesiomonas shigelloides]|uniref:HdeA/HdeB family chaperone n=1 Tax=Plesiomonas shigelloides TaxID=703 RepID=UPI00387F1AFB